MTPSKIEQIRALKDYHFSDDVFDYMSGHNDAIDEVLAILEQPGTEERNNACAFHEWVKENEWHINNVEERTHTTEELYLIYKSKEQ